MKSLPPKVEAQCPPWIDAPAPPMLIQSIHAAWLLDMTHEMFLEEVVDKNTVGWLAVGPYTMIPYSEIERLLTQAIKNQER